MSHGMLQSSECCVGTCVGSLLPSQATRHWFVAAQWHASGTPTFQCITYLQASLYCAELMPMRFHRNCKSHSFIICVWLGVQHLKLIWHWNAKHGKPAWWKNSNGNRFVCWAFCAPWTWKQTEWSCYWRSLLPSQATRHWFVAAWWHSGKEVGECILCIIAFESPQLFNTLHTFRHPCIVLNSCPTILHVSSKTSNPYHMLVYLLAPTSTWLSHYRCGTRVLLMSDDHNCFHIITSHVVAVDQRKTCLSSLHHFWKTCFRWQKSTSLSWFLATHLQPGKEHCCLLRCPTPSLDLDQPEYQPWCEAKWSMCIMPLLWANNWNPRETRGPWGELAEGRKATMRSFLSSKANVSWHAAIFKMLRGDMRGKLAPISSYPALIRCRSVACFRHPNFSIHYIPSGIPVLCWTYVNEVSPKLQKSIIYQLCMAWCPTSKTDLTLECQTLQSASWRNSNENRFVCWAFCAPWTWKQTECSPLTFLGQHIMLLAKLAPISSYPALIRCGLVAFRKGSWRMHFVHHCFRIAPTFQYITYLQASLYCAELMSKYTPRVDKNIQPISYARLLACPNIDLTFPLQMWH